jgi:hypothetical protein
MSTIHSGENVTGPCHTQDWRYRKLPVATLEPPSTIMGLTKVRAGGYYAAGTYDMAHGHRKNRIVTAQTKPLINGSEVPKDWGDISVSDT